MDDSSKSGRRGPDLPTPRPPVWARTEAALRRRPTWLVLFVAGAAAVAALVTITMVAGLLVALGPTFGAYTATKAILETMGVTSFDDVVRIAGAVAAAAIVLTRPFVKVVVLARKLADRI